MSSRSCLTIEFLLFFSSFSRHWTWLINFLLQQETTASLYAQKKWLSNKLPLNSWTCSFTISKLSAIRTRCQTCLKSNNFGILYASEKEVKEDDDGEGDDGRNTSWYRRLYKILWRRRRERRHWKFGYTSHYVVSSWKRKKPRELMKRKERENGAWRRAIEPPWQLGLITLWRVLYLGVGLKRQRLGGREGSGREWEARDTSGSLEKRPHYTWFLGQLSTYYINPLKTALYMEYAISAATASWLTIEEILSPKWNKNEEKKLI